MSAKQEFLASWKSARDRVTAGSDLAVCPYPGLRAFRPTEADLFFGRDLQIKELRDLLAKHNIIVVLGGSGSGKSSLVRAGLVPQLNSTSAIPDRLGAWYVVEFRPKLDPVNELFEAAFDRIIRPRLAASSSERAGPVSAEGRARKIAALNAALDLQCEPDAPDGTIEWQCRTRLRELLFDGNVVDVGALFDFVDERLRALDEALSDGMTSGPPNLMLLVDQFEEVFKPKVDPAGREMIMSLITSIHTYKPFNLFLIITMRSEELHRCAEFAGVTEVVNSSLYLVDLIGGRDIERAIVGPAQRLLRAWDLESGNPDTGPYTRRALKELHQVFDDGREVLRHPADQLPLMQHLLPLVWAKAVERWEARPDEAALQIDLDDLHALPGWKSLDGPLIGTLNERADEVLRDAVEAGAERGGGLDKDAVERVLRVAFCCLAQLDDRGNVVRDFATLDGMLEASGVLDRHPEQKETWKEALRAAFEVFERATLVNVGQNYDVNHEALIRGWKKYSDWLRDARRRMDRLVTVDRLIGDVYVSEQKSSVPVQLWRGLKDAIFVQNLARADQIAGDETSADLQDVFGPNSAFSKRWAQQTLERADAASPNPRVDGRSVPERLGAVRQTVQDAIRFRSGARNRPGIILAASLFILCAMGGGLAYYIRTSAVQDQLISVQKDLNEQFRFFRLQGEATYTPPDRPPRNPNQDRELYAALELAAKRAEPHADKTDVDESSAVFRTSLRQLDKGARSVLAEGSVLRILSNTDADDLAELGSLENSAANCDVADIGDAKKSRVLAGANGLGIELRPQMAGGVLTTTMVPVWRANDGARAEVETSNFAGQAVLSGAIVCLSHDANWLLTWPPLPGNQLGSPPLIQRIIWIRTGPLADRDHRWRAELNPPRRPDTSQSWSDLEDRIDLNEEYPNLHQNAREGGRNFRSFRKGDNVGFLIGMKDTTAMLWTVTGLLDPDPVQPGTLKEPLKDCPFEKIPAEVDQTGASRTFMRCEMGPIAFDGLHHTLRARYQLSELKIQLQSASKFQVQSAQNDAPCEPENALCRIELRIEYDPQHPQRESVRTALLHLSSRIKAAAIWDDSLWIEDANGQIWRYTVGFGVIKKLLPERWKGVDNDNLAKLGYSEACRDVKCDSVDIVGWPKGQQETAR